MIVVDADSTDIFFKVAERGLYIPTKAGTFHPSGHKALIRQHGEGVKILNVVKNSYKLVTHKEVYDALTPILNEHDVSVSTYHDNDGAKAYIDVRFDKLSHLPRWEQVAFRAIFVNGYGGTSFGCKVGAINFFCTNGMITGEHELSIVATPQVSMPPSLLTGSRLGWRSGTWVWSAGIVGHTWGSLRHDQQQHSCHV
jgi:hypothetical protein